MDTHKHVLLIATIVLSLITIFVVLKKIKQIQSKPATNWKWSNEWEKPIAKNPIVTPHITAVNYKQAIELAKREKKSVLVFFTSNTCSWCRKMKEEVLSTMAVKAAVSKYITVIVDTDNDPATANQWSISAIPAHLITNEFEKNVKFKAGFMTVKEYIDWVTG